MYTLKNNVLPHMLFVMTDNSLKQAWNDGILEHQNDFENLKKWKQHMLSIGNLVPYKALSKKQHFNYEIVNYKSYNLGISSDKEMLHLVNILDAHNETLEHLLEDYSYVDSLSFTKKSLSEKVNFIFETNLFFESWNDYCFHMIEHDFDHIEELIEGIQYNISNGDLILTPDGIVNINIC